MKKEELNEEIKPYKYDKLSKIPSWIKILLLKYWAAGAAFFFAGIGSPFIAVGTNKGGEMLFVFFVLLLCLIMEYMVKPVIRMMKNSRDNVYYYNMINLKGLKSFLLNFLYAILCALPIYFITVALVQWGKMPSIFGKSEWGLDPFMCGLLYIICDFIFLTIKNSIVKIYTVIKVKRNLKKNDWS